MDCRNANALTAINCVPAICASSRVFTWTIILILLIKEAESAHNSNCPFEILWNALKHCSKLCALFQTSRSHSDFTKFMPINSVLQPNWPPIISARYAAGFICRLLPPCLNSNSFALAQTDHYNVHRECLLDDTHIEGTHRPSTMMIRSPPTCSGRLGCWSSTVPVRCITVPLESLTMALKTESLRSQTNCVMEHKPAKLRTNESRSKKRFFSGSTQDPARAPYPPGDLLHTIFLRWFSPCNSLLAIHFLQFTSLRSARLYPLHTRWSPRRLLITSECPIKRVADCAISTQLIAEAVSAG